MIRNYIIYKVETGRKDSCQNREWMGVSSMQTQEFYWNEEQWLNAVRNDKGTHHYVYDDKGERILKSSVLRSDVYVNDQIVNTIQDLEPYTLYVNPYFVVTEFSNADKVSKHYYMGTQRVASELAVQTTSYSPLVSSSGSTSSANSSNEPFKTQTSTSSTVESGLEPQNLEQTSNPWLNNLNEALTEFGQEQLTLEETQKDLPTLESIYPDLSPTTSYKTTTRVFYWYHPDYIGNVDLVSDYSGEAYEFFLYNPWGENLYEWNSGTASFSSPYRFNGKELDQETGLAYYGARYYDNQLSMWLSVDPLVSKRPSLTPYNFVSNNPITRIDPTGLLDHEYDVDLNSGTVKKVSDKGGEDTHYFNIVKTDNEGAKETVAQYEMNTNEQGFVPFPESGPNWGRYGNRDAGGDNWVSPETAGAFLGLLYEWSGDPLTDMVYFDDISGNKGQNIGHTTHRTGDDIDIRYFGAGNGPNINGASSDCSTCWSTISGRGSNASDVLHYSTYNFLRTADKWGFNQNYAYPKEFPFTKNKAHFTHRHHLHIGRR